MKDPSPSIHVPPVIDVQDMHDLMLIIDSVSNAVLAAARARLTLEWLAQSSADAMWVLSEVTEYELDARNRDGLGQVLGESTGRAPGHDDPVAHPGVSALRCSARSA